MTPPPCNCAHIEQIIVWKRGDKAPIKPATTIELLYHLEAAWFEWRTPKTEGVTE